jgi:hypothetical protein
VSLRFGLSFGRCFQFILFCRSFIIHTVGFSLNAVFSCFSSVPQYKIYDNDDDSVYIVHPPTCCGGVCVNCWTEGNPCTHGCCKIPFRIYDADAMNTNGDAPFVGQMLKIPKETFCSTFNETSYYKIEFPKPATTEQKGLILGSSLLINSLYFEGSE